MRTIGNNVAFPPPEKAVNDISNGYSYPEEYLGLTKREYFAAKALQGLCADSSRSGQEEKYADTAVRLADALIEYLNHE
jgi:hypothetical protein